MSEFNRDRLLAFLTSVDQEILNIQSGEGKFRSGAIHFEKDKASPVLHRLQMLKDHPSAQNLLLFIEIAKQDFGIATAQAFSNWSHGIFPPESRVQLKPVVKPFNLVVKDGFYDMFKAANIPLGPKQVELLEVHALKLAQAFESKIATGIGFAIGHSVGAEVKLQLQALVAKSKELEKDTETPQADTEVVAPALEEAD